MYYNGAYIFPHISIPVFSEEFHSFMQKCDAFLKIPAKKRAPRGARLHTLRLHADHYFAVYFRLTTLL